MKYSDLISFSPIESIVTLTDANDKKKASELVKSYVMSEDMAEKLRINMISQLRLDEVVDNKGVFLVGNYGTGKSHLMSVISSIANDADNLQYVKNETFKKDVDCIAGQFEVIRIETGATTMGFREVFLSKIKQDFEARGIEFDYPSIEEVASNKETLLDMMNKFASKYSDKGYLVVVDEFLDFLRGKDTHGVVLDLGFLREVGEIVKTSKLRIVIGIQEKLFDNPNFSFVSETLNRVKDRYEQVLIRKEDTAYVVSERILKKSPEQKAMVREHLQKFCSLYTKMSESIEEYVDLYPIHPAYIDVFNKIIIADNRQILKNISAVVTKVLDSDVPENAPGIFSFDTYWAYIKENMSYRTDANIKEVVEKSGMLEDIINRSFPKKLYKPLALKIIAALSVHRLTTGDLSIKAGLTAENLRDDLCLYLDNMPDQSSDTLQSIVQTVIKDVMTTVSGQFIEHNVDNGQYYLDVTKDIDYDEKITQRAAMIDADSLNNYFFDVLYSCLDWDEKEYVSNFKIYEHNLNWYSHNIFRRGYLFLGTPESRPTAQPPQDYYVYFVPPFGSVPYNDEQKKDEVFFLFKQNDSFENDLKLYAAAKIQRDLAEEKNKAAYNQKATVYKKKLQHYLNDNKVTCFDVIYQGEKKTPLEIMGSKYKNTNPFKETMDLIASICFDGFFEEVYKDMPKFKTLITTKNMAETVEAGIKWFAGSTSNQMGRNLLESFDLLTGDKVTVTNSKYAQYFLQEIENKPKDTVINFSDLYEESFDGYVDKHFKISYALLPVVFLALVQTGHITMTLGDNTELNASNIDQASKVGVMKVYEFKYISKPKDMQMAEIIKLYDLFGLPSTFVTSPSERDAGLGQLLAKTSEMASLAVRTKAKLNDDFTLWGEPIIPEHIAESYKSSIGRVVDMFNNFAAKYNSFPKLNNFAASMDQLNKLEEDIKTVDTVIAYDDFRNTCRDNVDYMTSLERFELPDSLKGDIDEAKEQFRKLRDSIPEEGAGEPLGNDVNDLLEKVKNKYIDIYFEEHKNRRLSVTDAKKKGDIQESQQFSNLRTLKTISVLSEAKFDAITDEMTSLKTCFELTPDMLKKNCMCPKCGLTLGSNDPLVKGKLEELQEKLDVLTEEWTKSLQNTISDPFAVEQEKYLDASQQKSIKEFRDSKKLPDKVDAHFVGAIEALLQGFEPVEIPVSDFIEKLEFAGPVDKSKFMRIIEDYLNEYTKGKEQEKLRIIVKR